MAAGTGSGTTGSGSAAPGAATEPGATTSRAIEADVIVVGAGPAGSTAAFWMATAGLDVVLLEKSLFPREKVCGDGLTPRAVASLVAMGVDISEENGWIRNRGLRIVGGGHRFTLDWPDLTDFPPYGLVRPRADFDAVLALRAQEAGAKLMESTTVTGPTLDRAGRVVGVSATVGPDRAPAAFRAPVVVAADGVSGRMALALGLNRMPSRPMGVAVRTYYSSPMHDDDYLESWLELWDTDAAGNKALLPGYGWIFPVGDGTVNVGLGILSTSAAYGKTDYRKLLHRWVANVPEEYGISEETRTTALRSAALPMGFNRKPQYTRGMVLVGDSLGAVNPFNGEGIAYAMETGRIAADTVVTALSRGTVPEQERVLRQYPQRLADTYGGYYRMGQVFSRVIGQPAVMRGLTKYGLPHDRLMAFTMKLLANLTDATDGDAYDRVINLLSRVTPAA